MLARQSNCSRVSILQVQIPAALKLRVLYEDRFMGHKVHCDLISQIICMPCFSCTDYLQIIKWCEGISSIAEAAPSVISQVVNLLINVQQKNSTLQYTLNVFAVGYTSNKWVYFI